jgi:RNA recognition motif-containing protein
MSMMFQCQLWMGSVSICTIYIILLNSDQTTRFTQANNFLLFLIKLFVLVQLEPYMSENFILAAFRKMGEDPQSVKLMRNKFTGEPAGYCFVSFGTDEAAVDSMHKLNGKPIPGTNPIIRFRLNNATSGQSKTLMADREFSVWVGDLSSDVDDYNLYRVFSTKYTSIRTAKGMEHGRL